MAVDPSAKAFIGLTETKTFLDRSGAVFTDAASDDLLQRLINAVCEALEGPEAVNSPIIKVAKTEYYNGGTEKIILRRGPVDTTAAFTVVEDGETLTPGVDGSSETAEGGTPDYWLDPETGIIERNGTFAPGRRVIAVTYTAGRGTASGTGAALTSNVPEDLRLAAMIWVHATYLQNAASFSTQISGDTVIKPVAMPPHVRALVRRYHMPG